MLWDYTIYTINGRSNLDWEDRVSSLSTTFELRPEKPASGRKNKGRVSKIERPVYVMACSRKKQAFKIQNKTNNGK